MFSNPPCRRIGTTIDISPSSTSLQSSLRAADRYSQSGLSPYLLIPVVPSDGNVSVHTSMPIYISAVRGLMQ